MKKHIIIIITVMLSMTLTAQRRGMMVSTDSWSTDDIVSAWKFNGNYLDSKDGNNSTGIRTGFIAGLGGRQAINNASYGGCIVVGDADNLSFTDGVNNKPFSFTALFNFRMDNIPTQLYFFKKSLYNATGDPVRNVEYDLSVRADGSLRLEIMGTNTMAPAQLYFTSANTIDLFYHEWHHIGVVYYPTQQKAEFYIDGERIGLGKDIKSSSPMGNTDGPFVILGSNQYNESASGLFGWMQDAYLWNKALGPASMMDIATKQLAGTDILP